MLTVSTTKIVQPNGGTVWNLTGRYQTAGRVVNLRASTVKTARIFVPGPPPPDSPSEPTEPVERDYDYYYSDSEMSTSDGRILSKATYDFEQATGRGMLNITLGTVTLSYDLRNDDATDISDADAQRLSQWAVSEDAALVQDTSAALIEQGPQQTEDELLANYYAVAMLVDFNPVTAVGPRVNAERKTALHHAVSRLARRPSNSDAASVCGGRNVIGSLIDTHSFRTNVVTTSMPQGNCYGCCGYKCLCITSSRVGGRIYTTPCLEHDACVSQYGYTSSTCNKKFPKAVVSVWVSLFGYLYP